MPTRSSVEARDAGLRRVSRWTRGAVAAGVALTGAFSALASHAFAGRSGQRVAAVPSPADAVAPPAAETTTEAPTTEPPTTASRAVSPVATVHRPLQPPATAPRAVVPAHAPVTAAPAPVHHVRPHVVSGGS